MASASPMASSTKLIMPSCAQEKEKGKKKEEMHFQSSTWYLAYSPGYLKWRGSNVYTTSTTNTDPLSRWPLVYRPKTGRERLPKVHMKNINAAPMESLTSTACLKQTTFSIHAVVPEKNTHQRMCCGPYWGGMFATTLRDSTNKQTYIFTNTSNNSSSITNNNNSSSITNNNNSCYHHRNQLQQQQQQRAPLAPLCAPVDLNAVHLPSTIKSILGRSKTSSRSNIRYLVRGQQTIFSIGGGQARGRNSSLLNTW